MYYIKLTHEDKDLNLDIAGLDTLYIELNEAGEVLREIGLNNNIEIIHRCPSQHHKYGTYGLFDSVNFSVEGLDSNISEEEFEETWGN